MIRRKALYLMAQILSDHQISVQVRIKDEEAKSMDKLVANS